MTNLVDLKIVAKLCVEQWKLLQRFQKVVEAAPENDRARLLSQIRYSELQLQSLAHEANLSVVTFEGEEFGPGVPASAENLDEFTHEDGLIVSRTVEPAIVSQMRVILPGRVLLNKP